MDQPLDVTKARRVRRGPRKDYVVSLRAIREGMGTTQVELADVTGMNQGDISRLEKRDDVKVSTLRRYIEALGGELELVAVFPKTGHRMKVDL